MDNKFTTTLNNNTSVIEVLIWRNGHVVWDFYEDSKYEQLTAEDVQRITQEALLFMQQQG